MPVSPGNGGLAVGTALRVRGGAPQPVSPFLGPAYRPDEITASLDNCRLRYDWETEEGAVALAVQALCRETLVG